MATSYSPKIITDGLVLAFDAANIKSFRGIPQTNLLTGLTYSFNNTNSSTFKITNGTEVVTIPTVGTRTVKYVDVYNDFNGGSGQCCPNLFNYGDVTTGITGNTTYTYTILYKTATGYTHPNYMYRYEYNGGTYVTEAGVHNTSNRIHLGDGWYFAWGQFTTQPTTNRLITFLFHYEYATFNRVYVAAIQLSQGTYIGVPNHMLETGQTRGTTVATGGGWADLAGNANHGELVNGPIYNSSNGGSLVFDGSNDMILIGDGSSFYWTPSGGVGLSNITIDMWVKSSDTDGVFYTKPWNGSGQYNIWIFPGSFYLFTGSSSNAISFARNLSNNTWTNIICWANSTQMGYYINGGQFSGTINHGLSGTVPSAGQSNIPTGLMTLYPYGEGWGGLASFSIAGNLASTRIYSKVLTTTEVAQNFNTTRSRFGI
jgi:hypothetical protein